MARIELTPYDYALYEEILDKGYVNYRGEPTERLTCYELDFDDPKVQESLNKLEQVDYLVTQRNYDGFIHGVVIGIQRYENYKARKHLQ